MFIVGDGSCPFIQCGIQSLLEKKSYLVTEIIHSQTVTQIVTDFNQSQLTIKKMTELFVSKISLYND